MSHTATESKLIRLDGSRGEGGGQILRTALSLSAITGQPFEIRHIRAGRKRPGLLRQHLACVRAASAACGAKTTDADLGSGRLVFAPGAVRGIKKEFSVGSAGSTALVVQTVLPILLHAATESRVRITGGTHANFAPSFDYLSEIFLPRLQRLGVECSLHLDRPGFFPAGGGSVRLEVRPSQLVPDTGIPSIEKAVRGIEVLTTPEIPDRVAAKEIKELGRRITFTNEQVRVRNVVDSACPGNAILVRCGETLVAAYGERGKPSRVVAREAASEVRRYLASPAPVDEHLADQLLLPLALAGGGEFHTCGLTPHFHTNVTTIEAFLDVTITSKAVGDSSFRIAIN